MKKSKEKRILETKFKTNKKLKNNDYGLINSGITLISLVITIIVLLILAWCIISNDI